MDSPDAAQERTVAFLVALAEAGISPDVQELLVHGNPIQRVPPGALAKALAAAATPSDAQLRAERDEADRRAGAAERQSARLQDEARRRQDWLRGAKRAAGYHDNVSFDVVWAAALAALKALRWISIAESLPAEDAPVLVRLELPIVTHDVAIYRGKGPDGAQRWILGDINLASHLITHWAHINELEQ